MIAQTTEDVHHERREADDDQRIHRLEDLSTLNHSEAEVDLDDTQVNVVTSEVCERVTILVEGHPEEDDDTEYCEERVDALLDLSGTHLNFVL